ncbi:hypothetical protein MRB53_037699 [Persea americana]|nr:hypothetical protein MRB53_037699 [Persea americana]
MALNEHFSSRTRSYQQEMFGRSMEGNKIVVSTSQSTSRAGSMQSTQGTSIFGNFWHSPNFQQQRVWFLAPSVELCIQQHNVFEQALPAYRIRLLIGQDNVDKWSDQRTWDAALDQARVVVSTHAVLRDALVHGFVRLQSIALLVYDEGEQFIADC